MGWITYYEKITGVRYKHAWSGGEMYLKDAKLWTDAYYEFVHHKWVGIFLGLMYHGCPMCYDKQTFNTMLNKTMADLFRETERWIERVKICGYVYSIMWECQCSVIKYVNVLYLYPYVCKSKHYPIGHPRCWPRRELLRRIYQV